MLTYKDFKLLLPQEQVVNTGFDKQGTHRFKESLVSLLGSLLHECGQTYINQY